MCTCCIWDTCSRYWAKLSVRHLVYQSLRWNTHRQKKQAPEWNFFMIMASDFWKFWFSLYIIFENDVFVLEWDKYIPQSRSDCYYFFLLVLFPLTDSSPQYFPLLFSMILSCVKRKQFLIWGHEYSDNN